MNPLIMVQARMGSLRFPGKVLKEIEGKPLLWHVIKRLSHCYKINEIVVVTTTSSDDEVIIKLAKETGVYVFAGSEVDVLDRYYQAANKYKADPIIRVTGDCPLIDPVLLDEMIHLYMKQKESCDWLGVDSSCLEGIGGEVFSFETLQKTWKEARWSSEREHVTPYMWKHPEIFKLKKMKCDKSCKPYTKVHFSVDEEDDLKFVQEIFKNLYQKNKIFLTQDIVSLLNKNPELLKINEGKDLKAGYLKSIKEDKCIS